MSPKKVLFLGRNFYIETYFFNLGRGRHCSFRLKDAIKIRKSLDRDIYNFYCFREYEIFFLSLISSNQSTMVRSTAWLKLT